MVSVEGFINHARLLHLTPSPQPLSRRERSFCDTLPQEGVARDLPWLRYPHILVIYDKKPRR